MEVVVDPKVATVLPNVVLLFAKKLLGNVAATLVTLALLRVRFPTEVVVDPKVTVVFPNVAVLFARPEFGIVVAAVTLPVLALPYR